MSQTLEADDLASSLASDVPPRAGGATPPLRAGIVMPVAEARGGVEAMMLRLLRANLPANGGPGVEYHVAFLAHGPMVADVAAMGYRTMSLEAGRLRQPIRVVRTVRALAKFFRGGGVQVLSCWAEKSQIYGSPAARLLRVPCTWFVHCIPDGHWMSRLATLLPARSIFCCGETARQGQASVWPHRPTRTVYISVDLERFNADKLGTPAEAREKLGITHQGPLIGMVARLQRWKGVHVFLDAAAKVAKELPDARFVVVGGAHFSEPQYPAELDQQIESLALRSRVTMAGLQNNVPLWMQASDVLVHASYNEPTGTVILEGMALGKPCICAATDGPLEFLRHEQEGLAVAPGDAEGLAAAIVRLTRDDALRARCCTAAAARARQFGTDRLAWDMYRGLREAIDPAPVVGLL